MIKRFNVALNKYLHPGKLSGLVLSRMKPEERLAKEVADNLRNWTICGELDAVWSHIPNEIAGGTKNAQIKYAVAKHMGMVPGFADYVFLAHGVSLLIELKTEKGRLSDNQKNFQGWCSDCAINYYVCRSLAEVKSALEECGVLLTQEDIRSGKLNEVK